MMPTLQLVLFTDYQAISFDYNAKQASRQTDITYLKSHMQFIFFLACTTEQRIKTARL